MKKILFVSKQVELIEDMEITYIVKSIGSEYELHAISAVDRLNAEIEIFSPDLVVLYSDVLKTRDSWNLGDVKIAYCAKNREDLEFGAKYGIDTIGIANGASEVLEKLKSDPYAVGNPKAENGNTPFSAAGIPGIRISRKRRKRRRKTRNAFSPGPGSYAAG